ncbi:hypothetical protein [Xanthomonas arboricola]|nr:hypothetical protein [Xanthomonas arboricola]
MDKKTVLQLGEDGLPLDDVSHYAATPEHLQTYDQAAQDLYRFKVPQLFDRADPHPYPIIGLMAQVTMLIRARYVPPRPSSTIRLYCSPDLRLPIQQASPSESGDPEMFNLKNPFEKKTPREPWPLRFDSYSFGARCYHTLRCSIIFDRQEHSSSDLDSFSGEPHKPNWKDDWTGGFGSTEEFETRGFPSTVDIRWTAMDGVERYVEVDFEKIFPGHLILHHVPKQDVFEYWAANKRKIAIILLEVNDRTINVYMKSWVLTNRLKSPDDPNLKVSRNDLILAWTKTY